MKDRSSNTQKFAARVFMVLASSIILSFSSSVYAVDVDAGDYVPAPAGTDLALLYLQHATSNSLRSQDQRVPGDNRLNTDIGIFRAVHFMKIGGLIVDPQILLPFGYVGGKGDMSTPLGSTNGVGDPILAATVWVQNNPVEKTYTGITPYIYVPVGSYDSNRALNLGENRWRYNLQVAHVRPLGDKFSLDLIGDATFYGKNTEFGLAKQTLEQKTQYQAQAWLRYHLSDTSDLRFGLSKTIGGETTVAGVAQNDRKSTSKFSLGGAVFVAPKVQVIGLWGRDIAVENGFKESSRINVRLLFLL